MYALHHYRSVMRQSRVPGPGYSAYRPRNVRPCHRCRLRERPHSLPVRELQHISILPQSLRFIHLEKLLATPNNPVSSFPSRRQTSPPPTSLQTFLDKLSGEPFHRCLDASKDIVHAHKHHHIHLFIIELGENAPIRFGLLELVAEYAEQAPYRPYKPVYLVQQPYARENFWVCSEKLYVYLLAYTHLQKCRVCIKVPQLYVLGRC